MDAKIQQTKINAISAKILHKKSQRKYDVINNTILILTIIVPLLFIIAQYVSKNTRYDNLINIISFVLSIVLIAVSVLSLIMKVNDKIMIHMVGVKNNIFVANECDGLENLGETERKWFFRYVNEIDNQDNNTFSAITNEERQSTYREALKEVDPGNHGITCPICESSPWKFKAGDCQLCGNTQLKQ